MTVERSRVRKRGRGSNRARPDSRDSEARSKKLESVQSSRKKKKVGGCCGESGEKSLEDLIFMGTWKGSRETTTTTNTATGRDPTMRTRSNKPNCNLLSAAIVFLQ